LFCFYLKSQSSAFHQSKHKYFKRHKPIKGKAYRYTLTKTGEKDLLLYSARLYRGLDLSLGSRKRKKIPKYERLKAERQVEFERRPAEFERIGIPQPEKPKPTVKGWFNWDIADLQDYIGVTKQGAVDMGITGIEFY
jgi:hypothetical protein